MNETKALPPEALENLQALVDGLPQGPTLDAIRVQLQTAPLSSLFILSRKAQSSEVRSEAAQIMNARLHEDDSCSPEPSTCDTIRQGELPANVATNRHFYKFLEDGRWVLTTRSGVRVGDFPSEAELDRWWLGLKKQRGRILTRKRSAAAPGSDILESASQSSLTNRSK
jgi:hypothetical protein